MPSPKLRLCAGALTSCDGILTKIHRGRDFPFCFCWYSDGDVGNGDDGYGGDDGGDGGDGGDGYVVMMVVLEIWWWKWW